MSKRIVGLDFGRDVIRAVEVENPASARPKLVKMREIALPDGAVVAGEVREVHTVASALKRLWSTAGFKTKDVVIGMGNQRVLVRELTIPYMTGKQIRESLPFQVQDLLPLPVDDAVLDFYAISEGESDTGHVINGLLIAAVKEAVTANLAAVSEAGLNAVEVDLLPFALTRVAPEMYRQGHVAFIDIGGTTTNIIITSDGVPQFVRIISAGGDDLSRSLRERFGFDADQAENAKRTVGLNYRTVPVEQRQLAEGMLAITGELLAGIRNTFSYYSSSHPDRQIAQIVVSGGAVQMPGFTAALSEVVRLPVSTERPFDNVTVARGALPAEPARQNTATVALGLALGSAA